MAKKAGKARNQKQEVSSYEIAVTNTAIQIHALAPGIMTHQPKAEHSTYLDISGVLQLPMTNGIKNVEISIHRNDADDRSPGATLGFKDVWQIATSLQRPQFQDLLIMISARQLVSVHFAAERPRYGRGLIRSIRFSSKPAETEE
jgi:hypothetical protein